MLNTLLTIYLIETIICVTFIFLSAYYENRDDHYKRESILIGLQFCLIGFIPIVSVILCLWAVGHYGRRYAEKWADNDPEKLLSEQREEHIVDLRNKGLDEDTARKEADRILLKEEEAKKPLEPIKTRSEILDL